MTRWMVWSAWCAVLIVVGVPLLIVVGVGSAVTKSAASTGCLAGQTANITPGAGGLDAVQTANAETIIGVGIGLHVPTFGSQIAIAVARQESDLHNLANTTIPASLALTTEGSGSNADSLGLFQQRASWGSVVQRMTPRYAATKFFRALLGVPGWQRMALTVAAQAVQRSGTPTAYAAWTALAQQVVAGVSGVTGSGVIVTGCQTQPGDGYINPFADKRWSPNRIDQGVDYGPSVPLPVLAIGDGIILTSESTNSGWPGGAWLAYRLTSGALAGVTLFAAEHLVGLLPVGTVVRAGQQIATALPGDPWGEYGFANKTGAGVATPYPAGSPDGFNTAGGLAFARFIISLGAKYPGANGENPGPGPNRPY